MKLIKPTIELEKKFEQMVHDFASVGENKFTEELSGAADFADYIVQKQNFEAAINLKPGYVPGSTYWLVNDDGDIVGVSSLRHYLTPDLENRGGHIGYHIAPTHRKNGYGTELLKLTLEKAKELGLKRVLITCDVDNVGSNKIILNNGGVQEDDRFDEKSGKQFNRYWIILDI